MRERKCAECKKMIKIDRDNITGILKFQDKYYHTECFKEMTTHKAASKRGKPEMWQDALDNVVVLETETKKILENSIAKDDLNEWLLKNYDIVAVPTRFWQMVADLERGTYKGKMCRPTSMQTLLGTWKWGQQQLDSIARSNKANHKGPQNDEKRLVYDLAILVQKVPSYLAYKDKEKTTAIEMVRSMSCDEVDMSKVGQKKQIIKENIADIFNDLYVE